VIVRFLIEGMLAICLLVGGFFALVGAVGLLRLPDFLMRLHGPTKATTLGVGGLLTASVLHFALSGRFSVYEFLVAAFLFVTAPVSAMMLAKAALALRLPSRAEPPSDLGAE
jgi:multicomponent K+:H+ antiporter subunit G